MSGLSDLVRCFQDAALQRYLMRPREDDLELQGKRKIFHAIDSNVISGYLQPSEIAEGKDELAIGIGEIFKSDSRETKEHIARLVTEFIVLQLGDRVPLIALQPINIEIKRTYLHYAKEFLSSVPKPVELPPHILERLKTVETQRHLDQIKEALAEAFRLDMAGAPAMARIRQITRNRRVIGSDVVTDQTHSQELASALQPPRSSADMAEFARRKAQWMQRLKAAGRRARRAGVVERDAEALTRLELCNERLAQWDAPQKLVYVTADNSLMRAGELYQWPDGGERSFSRQFIRNPRAYLDEPDVLRPNKDTKRILEADTLYGWLTLLLERIEGAGEILPVKGEIRFDEEIVSTLEQVAAEDPGAASKILQKWREYTREAFIDVPRAYVDRFIETLEEGAGAEFVKRSWSIIEGAKAATWDCVLEVSAGARFALEVAAPGSRPEVPARETPRLVFEGRQKLNEFLKSAEHWLNNPGSFSQDEYDRRRKAVQKEHDGEYGDYMAHAYLLAQQMQWKSAEILASLATSKVYPRRDISPVDSNGRESSYLEAYCGRLTSTGKSDLHKPMECILRALDLAEKEGAAVREMGVVHDCAAERFEVEQLVLEMTRHLYDWHASRSSRTGDQLAELRQDFLSLADRTRTRIKTVEGLRVVPPYDRTRILEGLNSALGRCQRSGLGISLQYGLFDAATRQMWQELKAASDGGRTASQFAEFVIRLGDVVHIEGDATQKQIALDRLEGSKPAKVLPYDRNRYAEMIHRVRNYVMQSE